jgi:hypothetical protein
VVCGNVVRVDKDDYVSHVAYHVMQASLQHFQMPPDLTEEVALQVGIILSEEKERCRYLDINDVPTLSVAKLHRPPPPPPGTPSPLGPPWA